MAAPDPATEAVKEFQAGTEQLLQDFASLLQEDPSLNQEARELLQQQFGQALGDAASVSGLMAAVPDRTTWLEAVQTLQQSGAVAEDEANALIRQLDQALEPLQRRESQLAIEFSRRLQTEGEEKALAWFRQEASKAEAESGTQSTPSPPPREASAPLRSEVVNSRSRRLRGPPRLT